MTRKTDQSHAAVDGLRTEMALLRTELRGEINRRFDGTDQKFIWLAGTQVATLLAVIGVLPGALYR